MYKVIKMRYTRTVTYTKYNSWSKKKNNKKKKKKKKKHGTICMHSNEMQFTSNFITSFISRSLSAVYLSGWRVMFFTRYSYRHLAPLLTITFWSWSSYKMHRLLFTGPRASLFPNASLTFPSKVLWSQWISKIMIFARSGRVDKWTQRKVGTRW